MRITFEGEPVAKGRPRRGKGGHFYTPATTRNAEDEIRWLLRAQGVQPEEAELRVEITFRTGTRRRTDLDNLVKTVFDACTGVAWRDDSQVVELAARVERASEKPGFDLTIETVA